MTATATVIDAPPPPVDPTDPEAMLRRKLLPTKVMNISPRLETLMAAICDGDWGSKYFQPVEIRDDRVFLAGDNSYSMAQLDRNLVRLFERIGLTPEELALWDHWFEAWKNANS